MLLAISCKTVATEIKSNGKRYFENMRYYTISHNFYDEVPSFMINVKWRGYKKKRTIWPKKSADEDQ